MQWGYTSLTRAAEGGCADSARLLLEAGGRGRGSSRIDVTMRDLTECADLFFG